MTIGEVKRLQQDLNWFTRHFLHGLGPIMVDGKMGPGTYARIRTAKFHLGYKRPINDTADHEFRMRLRYPRKLRYSTRARLRLALKRRIASRARWAMNRAAAVVTRGVSTFDGRPVAAWLKPQLVWARAHGWHGTVVSGWRSPSYSRSLCIKMCGRPSCPGRCAGTASNHSGSTKPAGAVDVSDYWTFASVVARSPYTPHLHNALPQDRVHFSSSGR